MICCRPPCTKVLKRPGARIACGLSRIGDQKFFSFFPNWPVPKNDGKCPIQGNSVRDCNSLGPRRRQGRQSPWVYSTGAALSAMHGKFPQAMHVSRAGGPGEHPGDRPNLPRRHGSRAPVCTAPRLPCARGTAIRPRRSFDGRVGTAFRPSPT